VLTGDLLESGRRAVAERERQASTSSYHTEQTERFDLEESGEFLQAVEDPGRTAQNILDELDYQVRPFVATSLSYDTDPPGHGGDADKAPSAKLEHPLLIQQSAMETQGLCSTNIKMNVYTAFLDSQGGVLTFGAVDATNYDPPGLLSSRHHQVDIVTENNTVQL
jgi:hypothetical protein